MTLTITLDEVLHNNRFAVLATSCTQADDRYYYHVERGKDEITRHVLPNLSPMTGTTTTTFVGQCYNCHYRAHSQKHCPLRHCSHCKMFGHSSVICPTKNHTHQ